MRLAGYDWVPETKLTRSLREPWQRGRPGRSQNTCWLLREHATYAHLRRDNRVYDSDQLGQWRFWGLCLVTAYMRIFPEKLATDVATAIPIDLNVLYDEGNSVE